MKPPSINYRLLLAFTAVSLSCAILCGRAIANNTEYIKASGNKFVGATSGSTFIPWGMDGVGNDTAWATSEGWAQIVADMTYEQSLGINVVRFAPQFGTIINSYTPGSPPTFGANSANLTLLENYINLANSLNMRLDITGLLVLTPGQAPADPTWYDGLSTINRWDAQTAYWEAVSTAVNASSPKAVFCYDLVNEPGSVYNTTGGGTLSSWYPAEPSGEEFNQYVSESIATSQAAAVTVAQYWTDYMVEAIQNNSTGYTGDTNHMITVGTFPPGLGYGNFTPSGISPYLNFFSSHIYPGGGQSGLSVAIGDVADCASGDGGEPVVVEETMDGSNSIGEESQFILGSAIVNDGSNGAAGWITHFADTVSDYNLLEASGSLNLSQGVGGDFYEQMMYLFLSPDFGFEYPNLAAQVATPAITPSLTKTASGGSFGIGTYYVTCAYTWYSGLNQTEAEFTSSGDAPASITITTGSAHKITAGSVTLPTGATGLDWYMGTTATGPFHYQGTATVTSGVAAAFTMTSYNSTSAQPFAYPSASEWNPSILAPSGATAWAFSGGFTSGISTYTGTYANGLDIYNPLLGDIPGCPEGDQVAFITGAGALSESVYLQKGVQYTISFSAAQSPLNTSNESFYVELGGTAIGSLFTPATGNLYTGYTTSTFNTGSGASGYYTISFNGQASYTALIDNILINPQSPDLNFECPSLNPNPSLYNGLNTGAPLGIVAATGGSVPAGNYYLVCTYTWGSGPYETTTSGITTNSSGTPVPITTTGSTSTITACNTASSEPITLPTGIDGLNMTGVNWYVGTNPLGPFYYQGASTVTSGAAQPLTLTTIATSGATAPARATGAEWNPANASWTFTAPSGNNGSGISTSGTTYTGSVAVPQPELQTGMLKGEGTISQSIYLQSSVNYTLNFAAAQMSGNSSNETFTVDIDGTPVGTAFSPSGTTYTWEATSTTFSVGTSGSHTLSFVGTNSAAVTAFINNVNISPYPNL